MESINERLTLIINQLGLNKNSFSNKIGLSSNSVIENIVSGRKSKPSFDVLQKTLSTFESINARWLITGRGEMFNSHKKNEALTVVNEPALAYSKKCFECDRKQEVINMQRQRIETLTQLVESKNELIEVLKGDCIKTNKAC